MRSTAGRLLRIALGLALIWWGFLGTGGLIVGLIGLVPLLAGVVNFCIAAPLFGRTIWGDPKASH
jgi:hypothetical protein